MLSSLSLVLLVSGASVTLDKVSTTVTPDRMTVSVATSSPIEAKALTGKISNGRLHLYLKGVSTTTQKFITNGRNAETLARADYAKVEIPFGAGLECHGPISMEVKGSGAQASVSCQKTGPKAETAPVEAAKPKPVTAHALREALVPPAETAPVAKETAPVAKETAPVAAKAIAPVAAKAIAPATKPAPAAHVAEKAPEIVEAAPVVEAPAKPVVAEVAKPVAAAPIADPFMHDKAKSAAAPIPASSSGSSTVLTVLALAAIAFAGVMFSRRRAHRAGMIQILETAQLGPKRALVVARINGNTMILGSSEAGIALLGTVDKTTGVAAPASSETADALAEMMPQMTAASLTKKSPPPVPKMSATLALFSGKATTAAPDATTSEGIDGPEGPITKRLDEGGLLARLFKKRANDTISANPTQLEGDWKFDELLNESIEDEDLRRKLALGLGGKVS
jgi:flagellar biogenesis protein FliO